MDKVKTYFSFFLFSLLLCVQSQVWSQDKFASFHYANTEQAVRQYYTVINKAQLAISFHQFDSASLYYKKAFTLKYPNGKDLYNAFLVAFYQNDSSLAREYRNLLSYKGMKKHYFHDTLSDPSLYNYVNEQCDSFYNLGRNSRMYQLGLILDSIKAKDQEMRIKYNSQGKKFPYTTIMAYRTDSSGHLYKVSQNEIDTDKYGKITPDAYTAIQNDSISMAMLKSFILKYGYPGFKLAGFWGNGIPDFHTAVGLVLWHQPLSISPALESLLIKAVLEGTYPPQEWAMVQILRGDKYKMQIWDNSLKNRSVQKLDEINKVRASLYLPSMQDYYTVWKFAERVKKRQRTEYNPNLYEKGYSLKYPFLFYSLNLLPNDDLIEMDFKWNSIEKKGLVK